MALDIVLSFIGTCKVICLSKGQSPPYDQLSRILPLLGEKKEQHQQQQAHLSENRVLFILIHLCWVEKKWDMHTHASHFRPFLRVSHNAASFYLGTTGAVIQIGRRWQLWIPSVWCHSLPLSLWTGDRQSFLRLMPVLPSALKHGNYTSFYVPLVQACDSNSEPISAAVLLRITAWQRGVTMCMLSWKNMFRDNTRSCSIFHISDGMMLIPVDIIPWVFSSFDILIKY